MYSLHLIADNLHSRVFGYLGLLESFSQFLADNTVFIFIFSEPYAEYKIWIKAYTVKNEGKSSEPIVVLTDVRAPGAPIVVNLTCQNGNTLFLKWIRPTLYYRTVDVYNVHYRPEENDNWEIQVVETVNNTINHMVSHIFSAEGGLNSICNGWLLQMRKCKQHMTTPLL